ncbi:MAG: rod-binding protein [Bdellovibrionota bacterium]
MDNASLGLNLNISSSFIKNSNDILRLKNSANNIATKQDKSANEIREAARDFEAMLLSQMMNEMWKSVPENSLFGKSQEEDYFREMLNLEVAKEVASGQGLGVQDLVIAELEKKSGKE